MNNIRIIPSLSCVVLSLLILLLCVPLGHAQSLGSIVGLVTDASGAAVPAARVTVTNQQTGVARQMESDPTGTYLAAALPIGTYTVEVSAGGFKVFRTTDIVLNARDQIRVNATLELGQVTETVEVVGEVVNLQTENAAVEDVVSETQVQNISMNGRNFMQLAAMVPGASSRQPAFNTPVGVSANADIAFNGMRNAHNVWKVDGQENYDRGCGGCVEVLPSIDAIQEFKVGTANSDVDSGLGAGGQINLSIKSGTNDFHGTGFWFLRNDAMDATNYFLNRSGGNKQKLRFNTFGYNIGGPIIKNKLFFFWNHEWRKIRSDRIFNQPAVSSALRAGDFSGFGETIYDPTTGDPFPGNVIPSDRIDPNAAILADPNLAFPLPNSPDGNFVGVGGQPLDVREEILRVDWNITPRNQFFFRFVFDTINQTQAATMWTGSSYPTVNTLFKNNPKIFHWQLNSTLGPNVVNEASFSFSRQPLQLLPQGTYERPSNLTIQEVFPENRANRLPNINFSGVLGVNIDYGSWPWTNNLDTFIVRDSVIWNRGNHTLRFGGEYMPYGKVQDLFGPTQGAFTFQRDVTAGPDGSGGHEFASFLLGQSFSYTELERQTSPNYLTRSYSLHLNDTWRVSSNLTVNFGIRWDGLPHSFEENDRVAVFYPGLFNQAEAPVVLDSGRIDPDTYANPLNGMALAGQGGIPRGMVQNHWANFQPRVGIAWRPFGQDTVIRAGFGLFTERIQGNDIYNVGPNPPNSNTAQIFDAPLSNPGGGAAAIFPSNLTTYDGPYKLPQVKQYNIGIQHRLSRGVVMNAGYVGTSAAYLQHGRELNQPTREAAQMVQDGTAIVNQVRPYRGWGSIRMLENSTNSNYNSFQFGLRTDSWHGLTLQTSYTWSHAIDYVSGDIGGTNQHQDSYNWKLERASADFDRRHMLIFNYVYEIPTPASWNNALRAALGGWVLSGIYSIQTGIPLNVTMSGDNAFIGGGANYRPNVLGDPNLSSRSGVDWFDPNVWEQPAAGPNGFGNAGRNLVTRYGTNNWDFSLFKNFNLTERFRLQYRAEFYNFLNHTQWTGYRNTLGSSGFGQANSARDARVIQMGLKFNF